jgi:L-threonylcarbamoyladenylate synthase
VDTKYWNAAEGTPERTDRAVAEAAALLREGGIVAFPTETVYGLGADATDGTAVAGIFAAKGRPQDNPLIVHIADREQADALAAEIGPVERALMDRFWPGPLTLVLPVRPGAVPKEVTAGLDTVGVRMPAHPLALRLIRAAGRPLAAPSANRSGRPSPTTAAHVLADLGGRIGGVLDGGPAGIGVESTVVRVDEAGRRIHVLRPGGVTADQLREAAPHMDIADVSESAKEADVPRAPGMKYTHYAPQGELVIVRCADPGAAPAEARERIARRIRRELETLRAQGVVKTGVLAFRGEARPAEAYPADLVFDLGPADRPEAAARELYAALRRFDEIGIEAIFAEALPETGIGRAVMNRLRKASGGRILDA